jgi:hypothetical protein
MKAWIAPNVLSAAALSAALLGGLGACTTTGSGSGSVSPGGAPVSFAWKSTDGGTTGTMSATLPDGQAFSGPFLQITREVRSEDFDAMWTGWGSSWDDWGPFPAAEFGTLYSGRVMANLQGPGAQRMRCRFYLNEPVAGMAGGGQGECQLAGGRSVDAVFARGGKDAS